MLELTDVIGFPSVDELQSFLVEFPNSTQIGVSFDFNASVETLTSETLQEMYDEYNSSFSMEDFWLGIRSAES